MTDTFAWTANLTRHGGTELALLAATPTTALDTVAASVAAHPVPPETRHRVRAGLVNSDAEYPGEEFRLYRVGGIGHRPHHDLAVAVTVHQLAVDPPWRGLLDHVLFLAELGLDGRLRAAGPPDTIATVVAAAARTEFRYVVTVTPENTDDLDQVEGVTVVTLTDLRAVLTWLESLSGEQLESAAACPASPGMRIAHNLGPARVRQLRAVLDHGEVEEHAPYLGDDNR
ncbi:hypothetical protein [Nocardia sp. NPDC047038]|uniref:hypothetical protein n=1 Tax=Nocardia sp. NPDC047038 TaxID=3154338 RepID=UPI0033F99866